MQSLKRKLERLLKPRKSGAWKDILLLVVFVPWSLGGIVNLGYGIYNFFFGARVTTEVACHGPGFADFGCTGGWEAIVANTVGVMFELFILGTSIIVVVRLINRSKGQYNG